VNSWGMYQARDKCEIDIKSLLSNRKGRDRLGVTGIHVYQWINLLQSTYFTNQRSVGNFTEGSMSEFPTGV
jgi:hypothetical protein